MAGKTRSEARRAGDRPEAAPGVEIHHEGEGVRMEGAIADLPGFFQGVRTRRGQRGVATRHAGGVATGQDPTPESTARIAGRSPAAPPLVAAAHVADATFADYRKEAEEVDAGVPSPLFVAGRRAETAGPCLAGHCPDPRAEAFGGHVTFREHPGKLDALLPELPATAG